MGRPVAALLAALLLLPGLGAAGVDLLAFTLAPCAPLPGSPLPPGQPASGAGGRDYPHAGVGMELHEAGSAAYWLFEPREPLPARAPVVVFLHGFMALSPSFYGGWIDHLARRGSVVVFPLYQDQGVFPRQYTLTAANAVLAALSHLQQGGHPQPDLARFALAGHSMGGMLAANLAAQWSAWGLPRPRAIMAVAPGGEELTGVAPLLLIPSDALLLSVAGEEDSLVGQAAAKRIYLESYSVAPARKDFVLARSDARGCPELHADHTAANGGRAPPDVHASVASALGLDALDYYGWWKLLDALTACAWQGLSCEAALGGGPAQRAMGLWSDGVPVRELLVSDL